MTTFKEFLTEEKQGAKVGLEFQMMIPMTGQEILASLEQAIKGDVTLHSPDSAKKRSLKSWHVQHDATIGQDGVEITSPPMSMNDALLTLSKVCEWMKANGAKTSSSTALRIQVGVPNIAEKLDPIKLVFFMNDGHPERAFAGHVGSLSGPELEVISTRLKQTGKLPSSLDSLEKAAMKYLAMRGGPSRLGSGFMELRVQGGSNYESAPSVLRSKIFKLVRAVEIATDPAAEKSAYRTRLLDLLGSEPKESITGNDMHEMPKQLHRLYMHNAEINEAWKIFSKDQTVGDARTALLTLINLALKTAKKEKSALNIHEKMFLKNLSKEAALQSEDVDKFYEKDHLARLNFKKEIGL